MKRMNPDDLAAETRSILKLGIKIIEDERAIMVSSYRECDGKVRDAGALKDIRRYDRFLRAARKVLA